MSTATFPAAERARTYASFVRFEHTLFSLPLILAGVISVPGPALSRGRWALIALAAVGARTAAMSLNRLIDRRLDARNPRTQVRELPSGRMRTAEAVGLLVASTAAYLIACAILGPWFFKVAIVPLAVFAVYPYLKRFTPFCHAGVGLALALAPLAGYAAAHPDLARPWPALALAAFALLWVTGFDIIYATLDEESDRVHGIHSMVVRLGRTKALAVSAVLHAGAALALAASVVLVAGSPADVVRAATTPWGLATALLYAGATTMLFLEQRWAEQVDLAFFKINVWVGACVLAIVAATRLATGGF